MKPSRLLKILFLLTFVYGCNQASDSMMGGNTSTKESANYLAYADEAEESADHSFASEDMDQAGSANEQPATTTPKIIRTGSMEIEVEDYAKGRAKLTEVLEPFDVQIFNESEEKHTYRIQNQLELKVAPEQLDSVVEAIASIALHLDRKSITARDVTRQYYDLETRLASKRAVVARYREILKSARSVEEILAVEENLRKVIEEIEATEGSLRYLKDQVQYSTLNVMMYESYEQPEVRRRSFVSRIGHALGDGWTVFQEMIIGLVGLWPIVILLVVIWWGVRRYRRRK